MKKNRAEARARYYCREEGRRLGWNTSHPSRGGDFLEEQEIISFFPELKQCLGQERPDFVVCHNSEPIIVIETKNEFSKIHEAISEAINYAEKISQVYPIALVVGIAGTPDTAVQARTRYRIGTNWTELTSNGHELTQIPTPEEFEIARQNDNATTDVRLPAEAEFYEAAIAISRMLRTAKIEEMVRPKVIGAIILALYQGDFSLDPAVVLQHINSNVAAAISACGDVPPERRQYLKDTLQLSTEAILLPGVIRRIVLQLERLNVRSIVRSGVDFLGKFYEAFLRYGGDSRKLGIVFTPRHITAFCADLIEVNVGHRVYDPACGTGGFLVAAYDRMMRSATTPMAIQSVKDALYGYDTNSTVWALSVLNMIFRGDGKSHIALGSCFDHIDSTRGQFDRAMLNPPFSQEEEPEIDFIDHALRSLKPGGQLAVVLPSGILADEEHKEWRSEIIRNHQVLASVTMPPDLFYPTAAATSILVVQANTPSKQVGVLMARIENDGYTISKNKRVQVQGSQIPSVLQTFADFQDSNSISDVPGIICTVSTDELVSGAELCTENWLPSATLDTDSFGHLVTVSLRQMCLAAIHYPVSVDSVLSDFSEQLTAIEADIDKPAVDVPLNQVFKVSMGKSAGISNYPEGPVPYVSSGDAYNSIVGLIECPPEELIDYPCITVTAFGQACIQPWRFAARGNGGSAVRVLEPRFPMSNSELLWYIAQINSQRWRFHYGRMAIISRLQRLIIAPFMPQYECAIDLTGMIARFAADMEDNLPKVSFGRKA
ncbi:MAG: N-6 DNA methylase [Armatimonadetes bacterium]|nr:N-6 DNA methylase [Armatimonadota bacterium]